VIPAGTEGGADGSGGGQGTTGGREEGEAGGFYPICERLKTCRQFVSHIYLRTF
jgi:hypothetical protein